MKLPSENTVVPGAGTATAELGAAGGAGQMVDAADAGYSRSLKARHVRMIAIGGSIGTGLFLGAGGRLEIGGPSLALVYAVCGLITFFMMRALGEMAVY